MTKYKALIEKAVVGSLKPGYMRGSVVLVPTAHRKFVGQLFRDRGYLAVFGPDYNGWSTVCGTLMSPEESTLC